MPTRSESRKPPTLQPTHAHTSAPGGSPGTPADSAHSTGVNAIILRNASRKPWPSESIAREKRYVSSWTRWLALSMNSSFGAPLRARASSHRCR